MGLVARPTSLGAGGSVLWMASPFPGYAGQTGPTVVAAKARGPLKPTREKRQEGKETTKKSSLATPPLKVKCLSPPPSRAAMSVGGRSPWLMGAGLGLHPPILRKPRSRWLGAGAGPKCTQA